VNPPAAPRRPKVLTAHGDERIDDWYWLRERDNPEVIAHLEAENAYADTILSATVPLRERVFEEIKGRIEESDTSAPIPHGSWEYYTRTVQGMQYPIHCRRPRGGGNEQILLDENVEGDGLGYFAVGAAEVSPDHALLAFAVDTNGGERHVLRFRDLGTGDDLADVVTDTSYSVAWANDCKTCFYVRPDDAMRPFQVWRHELGTPSSDDVLVFQEEDERFFVTLGRTRSGHFVVIDCHSKITSEVRVIPTDSPGDAARVIEPRTHGHEYSVEHHHSEATGDRFLIVTNADGRNFSLVAAPIDTPGRGSWTTLVPHRDDVRLDGVDAFADHLVLSERHDGLPQLHVVNVTSGSEHNVSFDDPAYTAWVGANDEYDTTTLRYGYTSLVTPASDVDYDMNTHASTVRKQQVVRGGYDASAYTSARVWVTARDGVQIPLSIVHRRDVALDGSAPALLYGYGAYEYSTDAGFRSTRLSLLDRGFVFAIAHVRGGGELGRPWYEQGRMAAKANTFNDFIACAKYLVANSYTSPDRLAARGGSAGGLLMGAIANLEPDLFAAIVAEVPFVDVLTTMLDPELPLTITEWEEWGDPSDVAAYEWMKEYSPYDNVSARRYPAMLVTTGLNDPRVQYWEPAKWVQKLRAASTGDGPIILRTELGAGHGGPSGRYDAWEEEAMILAFICDRLGITE